MLGLSQLNEALTGFVHDEDLLAALALEHVTGSRHTQKRELVRAVATSTEMIDGHGDLLIIIIPLPFG